MDRQTASWHSTQPNHKTIIKKNKKIVGRGRDGAGTGQGQGRVRDGKTVRYMMDVKVKCHSPIVALETDGWTMMDGWMDI